jgi:hypothetical protein
MAVLASPGSAERRRRRPLWRWPAAALAAVVSAASCASPSAASNAPALEYVVKANYLYKFTPFVEWPPRAFSAATSPFNICVVGRDPFGSALDDATRGHTVAEHPIVVHRYAAAAPGMECHLLFASATSSQSIAQIVKAVAGQPVLTVTDQPGGMIRFVLQNGRVRFDVDAAAAQASGITISSKLLALAVSHRGTAP